MEIEIPVETPEEREAFWKHQRELLAWAQSLDSEHINYLCDGGWYNDTIRGYLIAAARCADFSAEQIDKLVGGLRWAFSEKNKADADKVNEEYYG